VLWVIGGNPLTPTTNYTGLQTYTFSTQTWQTITPFGGNVVADFTNHALVYLPGPAGILMYGGSAQSSTTPSPTTFLIEAVPPYNILSTPAQNVPVSSPLLLQWDDYSAITVGGAADNTNVYLFGIDQGWIALPSLPSLPAPLKTSTFVQATLVQGVDGSKVLELYDMSVSPNNITQIVLQGANGAFPTPGQTIQALIRRRERRKRDLSLSSWPSYNSSLAPSTIRQGFSLARDSSGMVAIVGGAAGAGQAVALFNDQTNAWINTTEFFGASAQQKPLIVSSSSSSSFSSSTSTSSSSSRTSSSSSTPTVSSSSFSAAATPTTSATPVAEAGLGDHPQTSLILGATLGSVLGLIALLIALLLILRWRRRKAAQKKLYEGREDDDDEEKDRMSFEDRGDPFMKEAMGPTYPASHTSMSVYEGQTGQANNVRSHKRSETRGSEKSTTHLVPKPSDGFEMRTINVPSPVNESARSGSSLQVPGAAAGPRRTSGWSRYFSGVDAGARNSASTTHGKAGSATSMRSSTSSNHDCNSHGPTTLPPLDMGQGFHEVRINRVVTGHGGEHTPHFVRESEERPRTVSSFAASTSPSLWSHDNEEQSTWTPMARNDQKPRDTTRDTTGSSYYGDDGDRDSRVSGYGFPPSGRIPSGAHVLPQTVHEEQDLNSANSKPFRKAASVKRSEQAVVSDLSWLKLEKK